MIKAGDDSNNVDIDLRQALTLIVRETYTNNCTGSHWKSELITKSCPWRNLNATRARCRNTCRNSYKLPTRPLPSSSQPRLRIRSAVEKHIQKQFGFRAFNNSDSGLWNALPQTLRGAYCSSAFRRRMKTHFFLLLFFVVGMTHSICIVSLCFCLKHLLQRIELLSYRESYAIKMDDIISISIMNNTCWTSFGLPQKDH